MESAVAHIRNISSWCAPYWYWTRHNCHPIEFESIHCHSPSTYNNRVCDIPKPLCRVDTYIHISNRYSSNVVHILYNHTPTLAIYLVLGDPHPPSIDHAPLFLRHRWAIWIAQVQTIRIEWILLPSSRKSIPILNPISIHLWQTEHAWTRTICRLHVRLMIIVRLYMWWQVRYDRSSIASSVCIATSAEVW